jgi:hypothetical protein
MLEEDKKKNPRYYAPPPDMLFSRSVAEWLEIGVRVPAPRQMFGPFWLAQELAVLFAGTGTGKSALATQIAESLARGRVIAPFDARCMTEPQRVLYLDFELNMAQLAMRYSHIDSKTGEFSSTYEFSPNLIRTEMFWNGHVLDGYSGFADMLFTNLANKIEEYNSTVLIVDNITYLDRTSMSNANTALMIMRTLLRMKTEFLLSILVLAHTPKRRPLQPLNERDLLGSINLGNLADSIFALGRSGSVPEQRYLKQIKVRSGRAEHDASNVPVYALEKFDHAAAAGGAAGTGTANFLGFSFLEFAREDDILETDVPIGPRRSGRRRYKAGVVARARELAAQGKTARSIAAELGITKSTAHRYLANG